MRVTPRPLFFYGDTAMVDIIQHKSMPASQLHEDKLIASATTADSGKVTTPSGTTNGVGVLRKLLISEIDFGTVFTTADKSKALMVSDDTNGAVEFRAVDRSDLTYNGVTVADAGKVWTPDGTGTVTLRKLSMEELSEVAAVTVADVGKVWTPDGTGSLVLRKLTHDDISEAKNVEFSAVRTTNDIYSITAAVDGTLNTASDFVAWPFGLDVEEQDNCTYDSASKTVTIGANAPSDSNYLLFSNITVTASVANVKVAFAYRVNGALVPNRFIVRANNIGEFMPGSRVRTLNLHPGDVLQLCVACDKSCNLTLQDFSTAIVMN